MTKPTVPTGQKEPWSIYIDMEGFSNLWEREDQILLSLGELMRGVFRIGRCYPSSPDSLFLAYQTGDAFLIVSDHHEESLRRAATIAAALLRCVAKSGRFAKASIAEGELADITGCYPKEVTEHQKKDRRVQLPSGGLMILFPVMGTALIRAARIAKTSPRGPLLTIEKSKLERLPSELPVVELEGNHKHLASIDWVHMDSSLLRRLEGDAELGALAATELETRLAAYCAKHYCCLPEDWVSNVHSFLGVASALAPA